MELANPVGEPAPESRGAAGRNLVWKRPLRPGPWTVVTETLQWLPSHGYAHVRRTPPEPPDVPLRGHVVAIATAVAESYGVIMGARRLRLRAPDRNLLPYYQKHGFEVVWRGSLPLYCEREIRP